MDIYKDAAEKLITANALSIWTLLRKRNGTNIPNPTLFTAQFHLENAASGTKAQVVVIEIQIVNNTSRTNAPFIFGIFFLSSNIYAMNVAINIIKDSGI